MAETDHNTQRLITDLLDQAQMEQATAHIEWHPSDPSNYWRIWLHLDQSALTTKLKLTSEIDTPRSTQTVTGTLASNFAQPGRNSNKFYRTWHSDVRLFPIETGGA